MSPKKQNQRVGRRGGGRANLSLGAKDPTFGRSLAADKGGNYVFPLRVNAGTGKRGRVELVHTGRVDESKGLLIPNPYLALAMYEFSSASAGASQVAWTSTGVQEFPQNNDRFRFPLDARDFDQVRWRFYVQVAGSGGSLLLQYATSAAGTLFDIVAGGLSLSIASTGVKDSGWKALVPGASAESIYVGVGGTAVAGATRALVRMTAEFRRKAA